MPTAREPVSVRHRYLADRILMLLLYRAADAEGGIQRLEDGSVLLRMGPFSASLRLNSSKCYDQLLFLQSLGYIQKVDAGYEYGKVLVQVTRPLTVPAPVVSWARVADSLSKAQNT